jgi:hypothetical protein
MSNSYTKEIDFKHDHDCHSEGCPGHKLVVKINNSVDLVSILLDDKEECLVDEDVFQQALNLYAEYILDDLDEAIKAGIPMAKVRF